MTLDARSSTGTGPMRLSGALWGSLGLNGALWGCLVLSGVTGALGLAGCRDTFRQAAPTEGTRPPKALENIWKISRAERMAGKGHWQMAQKAILESR